MSSEIDVTKSPDKKYEIGKTIYDQEYVHTGKGDKKKPQSGKKKLTEKDLLEGWMKKIENNLDASTNLIEDLESFSDVYRRSTRPPR